MLSLIAAGVLASIITGPASAKSSVATQVSGNADVSTTVITVVNGKESKTVRNEPGILSVDNNGETVIIRTEPSPMLPQDATLPSSVTTIPIMQNIVGQITQNIRYIFYSILRLLEQVLTT